MSKGIAAINKFMSILLLLLGITILTGCSRQADMPSRQETEQNVQWQTVGFAPPEKLEEEQTLWAGQYQLWEHKSQDTDTGDEELIPLDCGVCGELFWYLGGEPAVDGMPIRGAERKYVLEIYDAISGETMWKRFTPGDLGLSGKEGILYSMDMIDREHYVFRYTDYAQDEEGMYRQIEDSMVYTDLVDEFSSVDYREIFLEKGIEQEEVTELPLLKVINWGCDGKGNLYVTDYQENGSSLFYLFDISGELLLEYEGAVGQQLVDPLRTPEGEVILPVYDENGKCYEFLWADTAERKWRSLVSMEAGQPYIEQMYGMLGKEIYYRSSQGADTGIVRWNIESGRMVRVFSFRTAGIDLGYHTMLALREGQTPVLRLTKYREQEQREWLTVLTEQKTPEEGTIRVADLTGAGERVEACAAQASMETPCYNYTYEDASAQEMRERIMAELSQGKGPDLLFVRTEDLYVLEEKGLLLELEELIPGELREELLPGALELGTVDGRLLGVPASVCARTLVVSGDTWSEDTWRLEDIISLMEEGKLTGAIRNMAGQYYPPSLTVISLINHSLGDSFLIDWETGESHFDDERFIRLLELTYTDMRGTPAEDEKWLEGGKNIVEGYFTGESDFLDFYVHMEAENGRIVGYPTEGASASYLVPAGGVLVVNANIAQKEAAACFLQTLLGEEMQWKKYPLCMSVRRLSPEDYLVEQEDGRLVFMGGYHAPEVPVFEDGTTPLHRAEVFLENCVASPPLDFRLIRIISEELDAMYAENKSPEMTAEIINSRIQLYLDEGK